VGDALVLVLVPVLVLVLFLMFWLARTFLLLGMVQIQVTVLSVQRTPGPIFEGCGN
jgi:hypothetical protein